MAARKVYVSVTEAAGIFNLAKEPWKALPILRCHLADHGRRKDGEEFYQKTAVEKFAAENSILLQRVRLSKTGW